MELRGFKAQELAILINGFVSFDYHPGEGLLRAVIRECTVRRFEDVSPLEMSLILRALSRCLARVDEAFTTAAYTRASELGWDTFELHQLGLTLWGMVVLERRVDKGLLRAVTTRLRAFRSSITQGKGTEGLDCPNASMLCTAARQYLLLQEPDTWEAEDEELAREAEALWPHVQGYGETPVPSRLQQGVCRVLRSRHYRVEEELWLAGGVVSVDGVVELPCGARVVVEVDGPCHFFSIRPHEPTGKTVLKRRLLDRLEARGEVQAWAWVRDGSRQELDKVEQAVARARRQQRAQ